MLEVFAGNLTWLKVLLSLASSLLSVGVFYWLRGTSSEIAILRSAVVGVTILKFPACVLLYLFATPDVLGSDANLYYLPQANRVLSGEIPYLDFSSSYAPLFPVLLIPGLLVWPSPGSIVLTMLLVETGMLVTYALCCGRRRTASCWRVLFLYCLSPLSWYWVGAVGYNNVVIALFAMVALALAESGRDRAAGMFAALGLLFAKITMVLAWPGILFLRARGLFWRAAPLALLAIALLALGLVGLDVSERALNYEYSATSGNLWFLVCMLSDLDVDSVVIKRLSMIALFFTLAPLCGLFLVRRVRRGSGGFDSAAALVATVNLIFMVLAYKTFPWYFSAFLIFVLHTLMLDPRPRLRGLIPLVLLGSFSNLEPRLENVIRAKDLGIQSWEGGTLFALDTVLLGAVLYWTVLCLRRALVAEHKPSNNSVCRGSGEADRRIR